MAGRAQPGARWYGAEGREVGRRKPISLPTEWHETADAAAAQLAAGGDSPPSGRLGALFRKTRWVLVDQGFSSLSNLLIALFVARTTSAREFGAFVVALTLYQLLVNMARALASDPLVIRFSAADVASWRRASQAATGTALALGLVAGLALIVAGVAVGDPIRSALLPMGVALPLLLLQDTWRYAFFAGSRPAHAALNDLIWLVALIAFCIPISLFGSATMPTLLGAWGAAAGLAAVMGAVQAETVPHLRAVRPWISKNRDISTRMTLESLVKSGAMQAALFLVGAISGLAALGVLKGGQLLVGPLYVVLQGAQAFAVPEAVRLRHRSRARLGPAVRASAAVLAGVALLWGLVLLLLPASVGTLVLGDLWRPVRALIVPFTLLTIAAGVIVGLEAGLRSLVAVDRTLLASIMSAPLITGLTSVGALVGDATGAAFGLAIANCLTALIVWVQFRKASMTEGRYEEAHEPAG